MGFTGTVNCKVPRNLKSALDNPEAVKNLISKEIDLGRIAGPFEKPPFDKFQCSPIGLVPKKNCDFRLIQHLSFPEGSAINRIGYRLNMPQLRTQSI